MSTRYVLLTAAHNEERLIGQVIESVVTQTLLPVKWVIASDGSTDGTNEIVGAYARQYSFIELLRLAQPHTRNFGAQVDAINAAYAQVSDIDVDFVSNLDADITLPPTYYESLTSKFEADPTLGLAGGLIYENCGRGFESRTTNSTRSVAHAVQFFRTKCFKDIGGYIPLKFGGPDWVAEVMSRHKGWTVRSFPELKAFHHRPTGTAGGLLRYWFQQGRMDHSIGVLPSFELVKCLRRAGARPFIAGAVARLAAFVLSYCIRAPRLMPQTFIDFLRNEQRGRLKAIFHVRFIPSLSATKEFSE